MIYRGVRNRADGAQSKKSYGWADNMSQVDFGSWITNDFEKWITLKVAIPGQKVLTGQGDLPPTFLTSPYHLAQRKTKGSEDVVLVRAAGSKRPKSPLGCANRPSVVDRV